MRRTLATIALVAILAACGHPGPHPYPGSALDKATELVRQAQAAGLPVASPQIVADTYGTTGGAACSFKNADQRRAASALADEMVGPSPIDPRFVTIMLTIYCPRLL